MSESLEPIRQFVAYASTLKGDEKGEAQVFCDRLFQAFGHGGYKEAGATLEYRVKGQGKSTRFADLLWRPRLLIEMKRRGEKLQKHYTQAFEYWLQLVPQRPKYVILCNFDEFWIYDFDSQLNDPVDVVALGDLPTRYTAFNFLFPTEKKPHFGNNRVDVTRAAADKVAGVFNSLIARGENREQAQRFALQCVVAMFSEDAELLPNGLFSELLHDCRGGESTYDLIGGLFRQMNSEQPARGGRFKSVRYFNGGIFKTVDPVELNPDELAMLMEAAEENWTKVQPPIFGTLFQSSMGKGKRHAYGAHFTSEADIQKVVLPTIVRPWRERIHAADTFWELQELLIELRKFRVLDPACGSGNFLYVAYREMKRLELSLMAKVHSKFGRQSREAVGTRAMVSTKQFFGIEKDEFGVELAKVTLMLAKELSIDDSQAWLDSAQLDLPFEFDEALPLDNLDDNMICGDALLCKWPKVEAIIGNPPFQTRKKKRDAESNLTPEYFKKVNKEISGVPGRADYCVYWLRKTHDTLPPNGRAGMVGTNTIKQNNSRVGGLDYIVNNGGVITEAVSSQVWSGDAVVHVSIVNWIKGEQAGKKKLFTQLGDQTTSPWQLEELNVISSALSASFDVTQAFKLRANMESGICYQGQTHGHEGFLLTVDEAAAIRDDASSASVVHPFMIGNDLLTTGNPSRYVIDLNGCGDVIAAMGHDKAFQHVQREVMPTMKENAEEERRAEGKDTGPRQTHFQRWWKFWRSRAEMLSRVVKLPRYVICVRHTKRPVFEFVHPSIHPNDSLQVFALADDYSFGILQSSIHWDWFVARCSTIKREPRYTSETVFDSFPWPQQATLAQAKAIAKEAVALRQHRRQLMSEKGWGLRQLYRTLDLPGQNSLKAAQAKLDAAVRAAYGMKSKEDSLAFLLTLNGQLADLEASMQPIVGPGLPPCVKDTAAFITADCIGMS